MPTIGSALGIDGGDLFQIIALEDLGLDAGTIGVGLGLGVLSVPVQLWAVRLELRRARQRLVWFLLLDAVLCWALALLVVVASPGGGLATASLLLAVLGEVSVSVLYATSWQPLLSLTLGTVGRQRVNGQGRAVARAVMVAVLLGVGVAGTTTRVVVLVALGGVAGALALVVHGALVDVPPPPPASSRAARRRALPDGMWPLLVTAALVNLAGWPLFVTFIRVALWPSVNLGIIAAAQTAGAVVAGLAWRPTGADVVRRARWAALASVAGAAMLTVLQAPVEGVAEAAAVVALAGFAAAATTTLLLAVMELVHRAAGHDGAVRSLTVLDVVASTSLQVGLAVAGLLAATSATSAWPVDPYRAYLLTGSVLMAVTIWSRLRA